MFLGCSTKWEETPPEENARIQKDSLSYGMVNAKVKKGETTQTDIMQLFGAPNITSTNRDGQEVWMYDRISSESEGNNWSEARRFGVFFGLGTVGNDSNKAGSGRRSTTSTLTVIITFNEDKTVKEYSSRATQF